MIALQIKETDYNDTILDDLTNLANESKRIAKLIHNLYIFDSNDPIENTKTINLSHSLQSFLNFYYSILESNDLDYTNSIPPNLYVLGNEDQYYQVFYNILQNIIDHAKASHIHFGYYTDNNYIYLCIKDNGKGFTIKNDTEVFKIGHSTKDEVSGYGLYVCQEIMKKNNGSITISSDESGTLITLKFRKAHPHE